MQALGRFWLVVLLLSPVVALVALPPFGQRMVTLIGIYALMGLGYQLVFGQLGALNLAQGALFGIGAYAAALAGLPVAPLLVNADEVIGTGTPSAPNGVVQHPIRFTLNHMLNYWVWPSTQSAGVGSCQKKDGQTIPTESEISQAKPPASCTMTGPAGEIYRLKASVETPACAATSPQAAIIITAFRDYGIILADNGDSGGLIGTPDARWNDSDLSCLTSLILGDFEPVNVSSLIVHNDSGATSK